jgi:ribosomal protein S27AE
MKTPILSKKCVACGVVFRKQPSHSKTYWVKRRFCSVKCGLTETSIGIQKNRYSIQKGSTPWNRGMKYDEQMKSRLDLTGLEKGRGLFKGKKRPELSGVNSPRWKPKTIKTCPVCSKEFSLAPWEITRKFCSMACFGKSHSGEKSPVFKRDKVCQDLAKRIKLLPEYVAWREAVLERDNRRCLRCGSEQNLHAHHSKVYFFQILETVKMRTLRDAMNCKGLWDLDNGETLCGKCHRTSHTFKDKRLT